MTPSMTQLRASLEMRPTDELVSILAEHDPEEWRPEVFGIVAAILIGRGMPVDEVAAIGRQPREVVENGALVTIASSMHASEAQVARYALESAGIPAWVTEETTGIPLRSSRLLVRAGDELTAREVLEASAVPESDAEFAEPPCPHCGSRDVRPVVESFHPTPSPVWRRPRTVRQWLYDCGACGHRWPEEDA